jgi:hypothetical protein
MGADDRSEKDRSPGGTPGGGSAGTPSAKPDGQADYERLRRDEDMLPIDFNTIVLSLSTSALLQLGEVPDEMRGQLSEGQVEVDLPMARQTIDMLGILEEKTRGNLSGEEERLLSQVLYDVRLRYVQKAKQG